MIKTIHKASNGKKTISGLVLLAIPLLVFVGQQAGYDVTEDQIMDVFNAALLVAGSITTFIGLAHKTYKAIIG